MFFGPVKLEKPSIDVCRDSFPLLRDMGLDTDIKVWVGLVLMMPLLRM